MDGTVLQIRNAKNGTEQGDRFSTQNGTERNRTEKDRTGRNGTERNDLKKMEQERNDLAEGPCSRTERNDFKKSERAQPYLQLFHCLNSLKHKDLT